MRHTQGRKRAMQIECDIFSSFQDHRPKDIRRASERTNDAVVC